MIDTVKPETLCRIGCVECNLAWPLPRDESDMRRMRDFVAGDQRKVKKRRLDRDRRTDLLGLDPVLGRLVRQIDFRLDPDSFDGTKPCFLDPVDPVKRRTFLRVQADHIPSPDHQR
ncbi:MAG: hypothetical protein ACK56I_37200 [bacterium]